MKRAISAAGVTVLAFVSFAASQSLIITPKKVVYKRPTPLIGFKKTFEVTYPTVKAATPALSKTIEKAINPLAVLRVNIKEETTEYQWLERAGYDLGYIKNGILSVKLFMFGTAAYPDSSSKTVVIELKAGRRVRPAHSFKDIERLAALVKTMHAKEVEEAKLEIRKNPEMAESDLNQLFQETNFTVGNLSDFSISDEGVTFEFDYGFPHAIQALEPEGAFLVKWAELRPFIKPPGLLARFVR